MKPVVSKKDINNQTPLWDKNPIVINKIIDKLKSSDIVEEFFMRKDTKDSTLLHNIMNNVKLKDEKQYKAVMDIIDILSKHPDFVDILKQKNQDGETPLVVLIENAHCNSGGEEAVLLL